MSVGTHCVTGRLREFGTRVLFSGPPKRGSFDNSTGYWNYMPLSLMYQSDFSNSGSFSQGERKAAIWWRVDVAWLPTRCEVLWVRDDPGWDRIDGDLHHDVIRCPNKTAVNRFINTNMFLGHRRIYLLCYYCFNAGLPDLKTADFSLSRLCVILRGMMQWNRWVGLMNHH